MKGKRLYWNTWRQKTAIITLSVPLGAVIIHKERRYLLPESHSESPIEMPTTNVTVFASGNSTASMTTYTSTYQGLTVVLPRDRGPASTLYLR